MKIKKLRYAMSAAAFIGLLAYTTLSACAGGLSAAPPAQPQHLRCEYLDAPLGSCGEWMFSSLAGIDTDGPGFKKITIRPTPGKGITWVRASYDSMGGKIASAWKQEGDTFSLNVTIPPNTTATIYFPAKDEASVKESGKPAAKAKGVKFLRRENGTAVFEAGSGSYSFTSM